MKPSPATSAATNAVHLPAEEDRQLQGFGPGQQHAEVQRARELAVVEPAATLDDFTVQDGDLAGGTAEGNEAEFRPEAGSLGEWRQRADGRGRHGRKYHGEIGDAHLFPLEIGERPQFPGLSRRRRQNISDAPGSVVVLLAARDSMKSPVIISS